ncbi:DoxX family membrane protein [Janibacter alkaliphilus]|uniref:Putative membrane protein YphA (DoxX/SURF4 family) n=1 Tax=Janibacter alkaliphilus TaxID=1069963 RepID=A0A852XFQ8_9MICO|nr:DoxX family membrane protein [Janibacter alkaliphilus]NYG37375.1 putative membrane protein YphA (DoxX/SURF4 family) [Janibacter alkaliphilus]
MIVRRLARPMLAAIFISGGIGALKQPKAHVEMSEPTLSQISEPLGMSDQKETVIRGYGAAMVAGGTLLALGKFPRLASTVLIGALVPTTATHRFWEESDPGAKQMQQVQFFKNLGLLGGLMLAAVDTEGKPGVTYRAKLAGESIERNAKAARREAKLAALEAKNG